MFTPDDEHHAVDTLFIRPQSHYKPPHGHLLIIGGVDDWPCGGDIPPTRDDPQAVRKCVGMAYNGAELKGHRLHSAQLWVTNRTDVMQQRAINDGCIDCTQGVNAAMEYMAEHPGNWLVVGVLHVRDDLDTDE